MIFVLPITIYLLSLSKCQWPFQGPITGKLSQRDQVGHEAWMGG